MSEQTATPEPTPLKEPPPDFKLKDAWELRDVDMSLKPGTADPHKPSTESDYHNWQFKPKPGPARYLVEHHHKLGGFSRIYRAWDRKIGRYVSLKTLRASFMTNPKRVHSLEREAKTQAQNTVPGVVQVYDYLISQDPLGPTVRPTPIIIQEYLDPNHYPTVEELTARNHHFSNQEIASITTQAGRIIDSLKQKDIHHRDIKPDNMFFNRHEHTLLLGDFGAADSVTDDNMVAFGYSDPIRATTTETTGVKNDVWSLAATSYKLLTDKLPYPKSEDETYPEYIFRISQLPTLPTSSNPPLVRSLKDRGLNDNQIDRVLFLFQQAFSRDLDDRPETATDFATRLSNQLTPTQTAT